jgi:phospholipid/cholesterol/gamma-HCH transport system substrate-binding protein
MPGWIFAQSLDVQHGAVVNLVQNGGTVFADTFHVFPTFLNETKATMVRLQSFSANTDPLLKELEPVAADLGPTLTAVRTLSPDLRRLFTKLGPLITVSKTGLPGLRDVLVGAKPLLSSVGPFLSELNPILSWLSLHQQLLSDFISAGAAGLAAKTVAFGGGSAGHYLRQYSPAGNETLSLSPTRDRFNRGDTYPGPLWLTDPNNLRQNIPGAFDCANTGAGGNGSVAGDGLPAPAGRPAYWVQPRLPGAPSQYQIPQITSAKYSSR